MVFTIVANYCPSPFTNLTKPNIIFFINSKVLLVVMKLERKS